MEHVLVTLAREFAEKAHAGQFRKPKAARRPYVEHPIEVCERLKRVGLDDPHLLAAALLHDVVEDCPVTVDDLRAKFGTMVAATVAELSDDKRLSKPERKAAQLAHAPTLRPYAKLIKLADKTSNLEDIVKHPPGWSLGAQRGYIEHAKQVVEAMGPVHSGLRKEFDRAYRNAMNTLLVCNCGQAGPIQCDRHGPRE